MFFPEDTPRATITGPRTAFFCLLVVIGLLGGLVGCATTSSSVVGGGGKKSWQERQEQLTQLKRWSFSGRVAVRDPQAESWSASLRWQQKDEAYDIQLSGALGQGAARIYGNGGDAVIEVPDQAPQQAEDPEALMREQLGWHVPVRGLRYWLVGRPEPGQRERHEFDDFGRLSHLEQDGWEVSYTRYIRVEGLELPRKLEMKNHRLRVRLVIDQWQPLEGEGG